ncbi:Thioredoxin [Candidatus Johnevansia muelleri]|uniref:Thioredoxin n=1 Tax=Candidatus Johnevansia muelleri TaxID=1495769 RepID=A0A078KEU3_9GAMM|nr:Thioredoxin [Candidatus Evansia muelleri]
MNNIDVIKTNFDIEVIKSKKPVFLKFWAPWCNHCKLINPLIDEIKEERADTLKVVYINIDNARDLALEQNVKSIPTFIMFNNGKKIDTLRGNMYKKEILNFIDKNLKKNNT